MKKLKRALTQKNFWFFVVYFFRMFFNRLVLKKNVFPIRHKPTRTDFGLCGRRKGTHRFFTDSLILFKELKWYHLTTALSLNYIKIHYFGFRKVSIGLPQKISTFALLVPCHEPIALKPGQIFRHEYVTICWFCHFLIFSLWCNQISILQLIPVVDKPVNYLLNKVVNQDPYVQICFSDLDKNQNHHSVLEIFYQIRFK